MSQKVMFFPMTQTIYQTQPQPFTTIEQIAQNHFSKPQKDLYKALREGGVDPSLFPTLTLSPPSEPLQLQISLAEDQGRRPEMEDASFHCQIPEGFLMGIFDGHGDKGLIAKKAADIFKTSFSTMAQNYPDDFKEIFKEISTLTHTSITDNTGGTTSLVCYFDPISHRLHISNLGDGKAKLFRKKDNTIQCFPISIHRDWVSPKDIARVRDIFDTKTFDRWIKEPNPKKRRFPCQLMGINTSRSMGDNSMHFNGKSAISHTPRVTCIQCKEDDLLVMGCDGLWDFVTDQKLIDTCISPFWNNPNLAQIILNHALKTSHDNVTVICAHAKTYLSDSINLDSTQSYEDSDSAE
jgi:serine/threonine protein phosphatase PrpC